MRGFTLIELMISITIAATVIGAGLSVYLGAINTRTTVNEQIDIQESAWFIRQTLARYASEAGYRPLDRDAIVGSLLPLSSHEQTFPAVAGVWEAGQYLAGTANGIRLRAAGSSHADGSADGSITDCLGNRIGADERVTMVFATDGTRLTCSVDGQSVTVAGDGEQVLVERMVWRIGVDDDGDGQVDRIVAAADDIGDARPRSLIVHVLLTSASIIRGTDEPYRFDGQTLTSTDGRAREEYIVTVGIRN